MLNRIVLFMTKQNKCTELDKKHLTNFVFAVIILRITLYGGEMMAVSTIDRVRAAELKANEKQDAAELKARQIVSDAEAQADEMIAQAKQKADAFDQKATEEAKLRAAQIVKDRKAKAETDAAALTQKTMKLRQNVINKLILETLN